MVSTQKGLKDQGGSLENLECVLVMPAYNEQDCIESVVRAWSAEFERHFSNNFRMIIVNDGSRDRTGDILDRVAKEDPRVQVIHQPNGGHGTALLRGYQAAASSGATYTFQVDSDDQFLPSDFSKLWNRREASPFQIGYRKVRHDAFHRLVITRILQLMVYFVFQTLIRDVNIPYRLIKTSYLKGLLSVLPEGVFAPNIFLAVLAAKDGQDLGNIPVTHEDRKTGTVSIVHWKLLKVCFRSVRELVAFRISLGNRIVSLRSVGA